MSKTNHLQINCPYCQASTLAAVLNQEHDEHEEAGITRVLSTCRCPGCSNLLIVGQIAEPGFEGWDVSNPTVWWPESDRELPYGTPSSITRAFQEARRCRSAGAHTATMVMCRKSIEAMAKDLGAKGRTLHNKLEDMKKRDLLDASLLEWAMELKLAGNDAAHDDWAVTRQDADDALVLVDAAVTHVYGLMQRFEEFKQRREQQPNGKKK